MTNENEYNKVGTSDLLLRIWSTDESFVEYNNPIYDRELLRQLFNEMKENQYKEETFEARRRIKNEDKLESMQPEDTEEITIILDEFNNEDYKDQGPADNLVISVFSDQITKIRLNTSKTVLDLKAEIESISNIDPKMQSLFNGPKLLRDDERIQTLLGNPWVRLLKRKPVNAPLINITVMYRNLQIPFSVPKHSRISYLKEKISEQEKIDIEGQSLHHKVKLLSNNDTIDLENTLLMLITRKTGGQQFDIRNKRFTNEPIDKENQNFIKRIEPGLHVIYRCICEEGYQLLSYNHGLFISKLDLKCEDKDCQLEYQDYEIFLYRCYWKFNGISNGNRVILHKKCEKFEDEVTNIFQEVPELSKHHFSEFRIEYKGIN